MKFPSLLQKAVPGSSSTQAPRPTTGPSVDPASPAPAPQEVKAKAPEKQDGFAQGTPRGVAPSHDTKSIGKSPFARLSSKSLWSSGPSSSKLVKELDGQIKKASAEERPKLEALKDGVVALEQGSFAPQPTSLYHSTSSAALAGLKQTGGLVPASMLQKEGIQRVTGEGDQFSASAGEKNFISFGQGAEGLGTARAYFRITESSPQFSPHLHSDSALEKEIGQAKKLLKDWNLPEGRVIGDMVDKPRIESRLRQLESEQALRKNMPSAPPPYPILFELDGKDLGAQPMGMAPGEAAVHGPALFKDHLQRVFVPGDKVAEMKGHLQDMLGPDHPVQVIPFEAQQKFLAHQADDKKSPNARGAYLAQRTDHSVFEGLERNELKRTTFYDYAEKEIAQLAAQQK
ncbi:hypothetical protein POL68_22455 [Stigmatella sp. ncwal1]|uniref:Uncharacterized protein n=1 Tax=Stigmatella ashevillensis TaxID=2995309 RepID=A0ABT5DDX0_9BACT|nr:hypothetical protein [Stigmatella ashevillena]MDC0711249.1 hypothetical protein [Stigmatella ashevillena]